MNIRKMPTIPTLPRKKRVAAYARVSTGKDAMLHSLSAKVSNYSTYIQKRPEWLYCGVYVDEAITGTKSERPEFQRLLSDCRAGKIDMVITESISRFAQNTVTLLETVRELKALGIDVLFEEHNIHTMSDAGEMMTPSMLHRAFPCSVEGVSSAKRLSVLSKKWISAATTLCAFIFRINAV